MARCLSCQRELSAPVAVCPFCGGESLRTQFDDQLLSEVLALLAKKQKLEAVKIVKNGLSLSLKDAKAVVDQLEGELPSTSSTTATEQTGEEMPWHAAAKDLLFQGKKLHAIKLCREQTGCSLREAKEQVETLARQHGMSPRSGGCLGLILVVAFFIAAAVSLAY